ncbi:MAG: hypothetical protein TREMPRED_001152 [Tremellales sp. Tagirdzhanova-0007]|nr:MAG: hypothetical protein TREMPRED_001152 [Tremellales sp. Tagirdzhanova-0007]
MSSSPLCVNCTYPSDYLYTIYKTRSNIRLSVCPRCDAFLDPLIEHPPLILFLDLVLLKPRVFLHLLFNRGSTPFSATGPNQGLEERKSARRAVVRGDLFWLITMTVFAETIVRLLPHLSALAIGPILIGKTVGNVVAELSVQHLVTLGVALVVLKLRAWPILIPLTLLYTSLLPLLLQVLLSIWYTPGLATDVSLPASAISTRTPAIQERYTRFIPEGLGNTLFQLENEVSRVLGGTDHVWAGTRLLGGMSAGFGLRVLLPTKPWETTGVVLAGWIAAALVNKAFE